MTQGLADKSVPKIAVISLPIHKGTGVYVFIGLDPHYKLFVLYAIDY
jgi:hypothetical protein